MAKNKLAIESKLAELLELIAKSDISEKTTSDLLGRVNAALRNPTSQLVQSDEQQMSNIESKPKKGQSDEFSILLANKQFGQKISRRKLIGDRLSKTVLIMISIVMIALGFAMIIMPAPPFFEMYTIIYFTRDDGITLMDLISLLIILAGAYFLIRTIYRGPKNHYL